jgi:PKD repeat protein
VVYISSTVETWFSVKSLNNDGAIGERAIAVEKTAGEFGCLWSTPYAAFDIDCPTAGQMYCFTLSDQSVNTDNTASLTWYFPGGTPSVSSGPSPEVCYSAPGNYDVALVVDNGYGVDSVYQSNYIDVIPTASLPYYDGFEDYISFANNDAWQSVSIGVGPASFGLTTIAALSGEKSARLQNFGQPEEAIDELISGPIDLSVLNSADDVTLSFRYAYRKRNESNEEWLRVFIRADCLGNWALRRTIKGNNLSPLVATSTWAPSSSEEWTTVHMTNVTNAFFTGDFRVKFQFESDGGNNFYLDDINMYQGEPSDDIVEIQEFDSFNQFSVYPNPSDGEFNIEFSQTNAGNVIVQITDVNGKLIRVHSIQAQIGNNLVLIDTKDIAPGLYMVNLIQGGSLATKKLIIQ